MSTNTREYLLKVEIYKVSGCAMEVVNTLGHGLLETP